MISVIIPVYNVEKYINKGVDSALNQTYKDVEIILVDDGSLDNCASICDNYLLKDSRIIVIHKQNGGLSSARNKGIDISSGELLTFLDSDDYVLPEMLTSMDERLVASDADMCLCGFNRVDETDRVLSTTSFKDAVLIREEALEMLVQGNVCFITAWAKLYKRVLFSELRFAEGKLHEDEFLAHHVLAKCKTVISVSNTYYQYLQRATSIIGSLKKDIRWFNCVEAYIDRYEYFHQIGEVKFAARMLAQTIPLLLSVQKQLHDAGSEATIIGKKHRERIIESTSIVDCSLLPITMRIGIAAYRMSDNMYLAWRKVYALLLKPFRG